MSEKRTRQPQRWALELVDQIAGRIEKGEELPFYHGVPVALGWAKRFAQEGGFARKTRLSSSAPYQYNWSLIVHPLPTDPSKARIYVNRPGRARDQKRDSAAIEELVANFSAWNEEHESAQGPSQTELNELPPPKKKPGERDDIDDVLKQHGYF